MVGEFVHPGQVGSHSSDGKLRNQRKVRIDNCSSEQQEISWEMILFITQADDSHADSVSAILHARGIRFRRIDTSRFPNAVRATLSFVPSGGTRHCRFSDDGGSIDLSEVTTIWNRRPQEPEVLGGMDDCARRFARNECLHFLRGLWLQLSDRYWVNPYDAAILANSKPYQLRIAEQTGFRIPRTIMTTVPADAIEFAQGLDTPVVYKPFTPYSMTKHEDRGDYREIYTTVVTADEIRSRSKQIKLAPCIFQEYIPKDFEVRATVVGESIFAAKIESQRSERAKHDWRHYDLKNTPHGIARLPGDIEEKIFRLMRNMRLSFGCLDFIVTPDGEYVFLEVNQAGQWYWIESLTGLPISEAFADLLATGSIAKANNDQSVAPSDRKAKTA